MEPTAPLKTKDGSFSNPLIKKYGRTVRFEKTGIILPKKKTTHRSSGGGDPAECAAQSYGAAELLGYLYAGGPQVLK